jgi:hypothetical protein
MELIKEYPKKIYHEGKEVCDVKKDRDSIIIKFDKKFFYGMTTVQLSLLQLLVRGIRIR